MLNFVINLLITILTIVPVIIAVAFFTLAERKIMGSIQRRVGPNVVGFWGILQPIADGLKLILKELILPSKAFLLLFLFAPLLTFFLSLINWVVIPFNFQNIYVDLTYGIFFFLSVSSLGVYGIILAGWAGNSKYGFLGSSRSISQLISYELIFSLAIFPIILITNSLNFSFIVYFQVKSLFFVFPLFPAFILFLIAMLAETNRTPFDLAEAEAELVAGYNVEYSSIIFAMFFLGEYSNMLLMCSCCILFYFGGWSFLLQHISFGEIFFAVKLVFFCFFFIFIRAQLPRYRYDQLMVLCWKILLPFGFGYSIFIINVIFFLDIKNLIYENIINTSIFLISNCNIWKFFILDFDRLPETFFYNLFFYDYKQIIVGLYIF